MARTNVVALWAAVSPATAGEWEGRGDRSCARLRMMRMPPAALAGERIAEEPEEEGSRGWCAPAASRSPRAVIPKAYLTFLRWSKSSLLLPSFRVLLYIDGGGGGERGAQEGRCCVSNKGADGRIGVRTSLSSPGGSKRPAATLYPWHFYMYSVCPGRMMSAGRLRK